MSKTKIVGVYITVAVLKDDRDLNWELQLTKRPVGEEFDGPRQAFAAVGDAIADSFVEVVEAIDEQLAIASKVLEEQEAKEKDDEAARSSESN